ncbi:hypothetical protein QOK74_08565 [Staphylococcus saprophyticus]|uniref:hypothetical protein n=1 Tax=Staphylococcus saprophyticus TaxID=29385 RepID=UPI0024C2B08B|nr:hypothetical protein [Staphylococcus saprophyticus]MDK1672925.1 hypothetical protein [Staphylococcus saprophyticus]
MENEKVIEVQISGFKEKLEMLEDRQEKFDEKLDKTIEKQTEYQEINNERFLDLRIITTQLVESTKNVEKNTERTANVMEKFADDDKKTKDEISKKFSEVDNDINDIKTDIKLNLKNESNNSLVDNSSENRISAKTWGVILVAMFGLMETIVKVVAPLLAPLIGK